jgi:Fe-S-cluster containining protein
MSIELVVLQDTYQFAAGIDQSPCDGCDECGARCIAGVPLLRAEFLAIQEFRSGPEGAEVARVEREEKRTLYPGAEDVYYTACRFRDHGAAAPEGHERTPGAPGAGRCAIYPVRPLICRLFGHVEWLPCPIQKVPGPTPGGLAAMRRYAGAPQKTYEEWLEEPVSESPSWRGF